MIFDRKPVNPLPRPPSSYLLVTFHRRENWATGLDALCEALKIVLDRQTDAEVVFPVHPNPNVGESIVRRLGQHPRIHLIEPVGYPAFVALMRDSRLILTDSGGIQEEAPALGKTVLVARGQTERPEGLATGLVHVVPLEGKSLAECVLSHWSVCHASPPEALKPTPYGDGRAAERIVRALASWFDCQGGASTC
jgi:UDP-N-acetylglucosamine 2-epimerase (non-hydrolysing)